MLRMGGSESGASLSCEGNMMLLRAAMALSSESDKINVEGELMAEQKKNEALTERFGKSAEKWELRW